MTDLARANIAAAAKRIEPYIRRTPVMDLRLATHDTPINLKLELFQHTGSFKARGAFNSVVGKSIPSAGIAAVSGGNHGAAVALAANTFGHKARIFVPGYAPAAKVALIKSYGAEIVQEGDDVAHVIGLWNDYVATTGALSIHPYDAPATLQGQATVALEWDQQTPDLDTVLVAVGGGGLIGGVAGYFDRAVKVVAVETENTAALNLARSKGEPTNIKPSGVAADSLGANRIGNMAFAMIGNQIADSILVTDKSVLEAQRHLWNSARIVTEPGGATALAAILSGIYQPEKGERIGVLICGGNTDLEVFARTIRAF